MKDGDTADGKSYGDQGIKIINTKNLELKFIAYFVEGNKDKAFGDMLADNYENGVWYTQRSISFPTNVEQNRDATPDNYSLSQNYPNPFNSSTLISFQLPHTSNVELEIVDLNGRVIKSLVNENKAAGSHDIRWNGKNEFGEDVPSGVYFYRLRADDFSASKKLLLVK